MKNIVWSDLRSGLVVFFVALPLCLGIAMACGVPPESGLWAGIVGGIITTIFSGSRLSVSGPAAGLISIVLSGITSVKSMEHFYLAVCFAGVFQLLLRLLNLGRLTAFIPNAVIYGMLSGVGIIIILKQIPHLIGYDPDYEGDFSFTEPYGSNTFSSIYQAFINLHDGPLVIGLLSLLLLITGENFIEKKFKLFRIVPTSLITVIIGIILVIFFNKSSHDAFHVYEDNRVILPPGNEIFHILKPDFSSIWYFGFWKLVITLGLVATLESLLCVEAIDKIDPDKQISDKNKELVAQGVGNIICGLLCALPITSVIVRSSANLYSGAKTKLSAIAHGFYLLIALLIFSDTLSLIPKATLAAILILVGYKLNKPTLYIKMYKSGWSQFLPFIITLMVMIFTDLLTGVLIGFVVSLISILYRTALSPIDIKHKENTIEIQLPQYVTFFHKGKLEIIQKKFKGKKILMNDDQCKYIDPDCMEIIEIIKQFSI